MLPPLDYSHAGSPFYTSAGQRMTFDPTKSLNYKVVHVGRTSSHIDIQTYYSEKGNWKLCRDWFNFFSFDHFDNAIYWNGALHWLETEDIQDGNLKHYNIYIKDHDHPILTTIQIHQGLHRSRGCLLAVDRDYIGSREFTIYEMRKGCSVWSVRFESYHGPSGAEINRSVAVLWRKHSLPLNQPLKSAYFAYDLGIKYAYHNRLGGRLGRSNEKHK
ncbi:hypothetical protein Tco_0033601 [Tanacetum coccineum]